MNGWSSLKINCIHGLLAVLNAVLGLLQFHFHDYLGVSFSFAALIAVAYANWCSRKTRRLQARLNELRREAAGMTDEELIKARDLAVANLERVARLVGASFTYDSATLQIGRYAYLIRPDEIRRQLVDSMCPYQETCLRVRPDMPRPEKIASILLLLKNDPTIFDRWAQQDEFYA